MEKLSEAILSLCRDPMLVLKGTKVQAMNAAAAALFPLLNVGAGAVGELPDHILFAGPEQQAMTAVIGEREFTVNLKTEGEKRVVAFRARVAADAPRLLSDGAITQLLSTVANASLAADRVAKNAASDDPQQKQELARLRRSQYALKRQLDNLNGAVHLTEGSAWLNAEMTDLVALCADLADSVSVLLDEGRASLCFSSPLPELVACVDSRLVERLLLNLIANSLEHTPAGGEVRLRVAKNGGNAVLSVEDNGSGIPPEIMQNVFTRYESRADRRHIERAGMAGLGLTVASGIASLHRGALVIESRVGEGTTVRVMLPLEQPEKVPLRGSDDPHPDGLKPILTELAGLLPLEAYSEEYLD